VPAAVLVGPTLLVLLVVRVVVGLTVVLLVVVDDFAVLLLALALEVLVLTAWVDVAAPPDPPHVATGPPGAVYVAGSNP
jgi:hypothetical protein